MSNRRSNDEVVVGILMAVVLVAILGFSIWARVSGPCSMWTWMPAKDVPGRCFMK